MFCFFHKIHQITGRRVTKSGKEEYLVHWKNYNYLNRTWEPIENLTACLGTVTEFMAKAYPMPGMVCWYAWGLGEVRACACACVVLARTGVLLASFQGSNLLCHYKVAFRCTV